MILSSHDQELVFSNDRDDGFETANIDDLTIEVGQEASVLQDTIVARK